MSNKIIIVEDHPLMRKGLSLTLEAEMDFTVCGQFADAESALAQVGVLEPDLAVVDISLPGMSGLELIKHLQAQKPDLKVLVVSRHDEALYAERALRAGAKGYIMKLEAADVIVKAARRVLRGGIYVSEEVNERLLMGMATGRRELVFEMTGRGLGTRDIAERLHLSLKTVESYRARIKTKLNLSTAAELMQHAVQWVENERVD